jgi:peptidyl-prolyl cis-trans isomerase SurA
MVIAQTLFTYGNKKVEAREFLTAFHKNTDQNNDPKIARSQFLQTYINYKLKLEAAFDEKLYQTTSFISENNNFKRQLAESIINKQANENILLQEAFDRSKKDVLVQQIFIEFGKDTLAAFKKINVTYHKLKSGASFSEQAVTISTDSISKFTKGIIGYITVFSLPYEIENIIYQLAPGSISTPYKSKFGYHIFKILSVRTAAGRRVINQILLPYPVKSTVEDKIKLAVLADSVYQQLKRGLPFSEAQRKFNNMQNANIEIGIGEYDSVFESKVYQMNLVNEITKPFETAYGINILQLQKILPTPASANDKFITEQVEKGDRLSLAKKELLIKWKKQINFRETIVNIDSLKKYIDFALHRYNWQTSIKDSTVLFFIKNQKVTAIDFKNYIQQFPVLKINDQLKSFKEQKTGEYYRMHFEEFDNNAKEQLSEFFNANLLFAAMNIHVWNKTESDSIGLKKFYLENTSKYLWQNGFSALTVSASNETIAKEIAEKIQSQPGSWRKIIANYNSFASADSGRFETIRLNQFQNIILKKNMLIDPVKTDQNVYVFYYITDIHAQPEQKSFEEAKGLVITDYQALVEKNWILDLHQKYPVKINYKVLNTIK